MSDPTWDAVRRYAFGTGTEFPTLSAKEIAWGLDLPRSVVDDLIAKHQSEWHDHPLQTWNLPDNVIPLRRPA